MEDCTVRTYPRRMNFYALRLPGAYTSESQHYTSFTRGWRDSHFSCIHRCTVTTESTLQQATLFQPSTALERQCSCSTSLFHLFDTLLFIYFTLRSTDVAIANAGIYIQTFCFLILAFRGKSNCIFLVLPARLPLRVRLLHSLKRHCESFYDLHRFAFNCTPIAVFFIQGSIIAATYLSSSFTVFDKRKSD